MEIKHKRSFNTIFGSLISIISIISIILILFLFSKDLIFKNNPDVIHTVYKDENPSRLMLNNDNFILTLGVTFGGDIYTIDNSIYYIEAYQNTMIRPGNGTYTKKMNPIKLKRCNETKISLLIEYFSREDLTNLYCFDNLDNYLQGEYGQEEYTWIEISLKICNKSISICKSPEEIESKLDGAYISIYMTDTSITPDNYKKPIQLYGKNLYDLMTLKNYKESNIFMKKIDILTDDNWISGSSISTSTFSLNDVNQLWDFKEIIDVFYKVNLRVSNIRDVYKRRYLKLHNILSNIGGFIKLIMILGDFIVFYYSELCFNEYITNFFDTIESENNYNKIDNQISLKSENNININMINSYSDNLMSIHEKNQKRDLNFLEKINSICFFDFCKTKNLRTRLKKIKNDVDKIRCKFDWVNLIKFQNEYELIKLFILNKSQNDIVTLNFNSYNNKILHNFYMNDYNLDKLPKYMIEESIASYKKLLESEDSKSKIILQMINPKIKNMFDK